MIYQELLRNLTESYLKSLVSEASESLNPDFDSFAPFGELGINSFSVLQIIKRLELDFGTLPKSLLFENFNISDLANYFIGKHEQTLAVRFAEQLQGTGSGAHGKGRQRKPIEVREEAKRPAASRASVIARESEPIRILEKEVPAHPELQKLVQMLFDRYKTDSGVSRGTRKIAPNLFIGSARRGYFNYGRSRTIILVYGYTGPRDYLPALAEEMYRYCETNNFQLNILADGEVPAIGGKPFSATPFGALQRILNLKGFTLEGGAMRRLRYQVSKFEKSGACRTEEYRCGSSPEIDGNIASIIDKWCEGRTMVNPLVRDVKEEILAGTLRSEHRLFLTYLDDALQNVILITALCPEVNGYLMDLEFYPSDMPMGGLEFAIVQIIGVLTAEGCDLLSLGGTYGCKLSPSSNPDPEIDKILDDLREQKIFNDEGNLQFKNKFRPENKSVFLCRPVGSANPDNVIDIIMMIADPEKMQTSEEENHNFSQARGNVASLVEQLAERSSSSSDFPQTGCDQLVIEGDDRSRILANVGFNPLSVSHELVEFDLKTDSWAQLEMPAIDAHVRHLHAQLQQPVNIDEIVRTVFPFAHFVLTNSGQAAEHIFFKAWPKKGVVPQNLLFPSTIFHQIDNGFTPAEMPHPAVFHLNSREPYKGNMAWDKLQAVVAKDPDAIAFVCVEVNDNAAGGYQVSMQHLRDVKALLARQAIPLVIDSTRVMENAQFLIEHEKEQAGKSIWTVVREMLSYADAIIGSLTKDFCVNKGGIIATSDARLFHTLQELVQKEGAGLDLIDRKTIALSLQNRQHIEAKVLRRMEGVRLIWKALNESGVPVVHPAGGHCVLIDVKQIPEFQKFKCPVASFVAWLYLNTGIRAGAHSVGMQKDTSINDLVRLAIPVGLKQGQMESVIHRLLRAFDAKINIPEVVIESGPIQPLEGVYANYKLVKYHNVSGNVVFEKDSTTASSEGGLPAKLPSVVGSLPGSPKLTQCVPSGEIAGPAKTSQETESGQITENRRPRQEIAIVGMAGRYPRAKNLRELWENLAQGRDCVDEIPADRYEQRLQFGSAEKYRGGFIADVEKFDSLFFNISPREAEMMDPQERLFLEVAWEAIEDAGYYPEILAQEGAPRNIGVFVGAVWAMYQMLGVEEKHFGIKTSPNSFLWSIANRVSYWMNLSGPSLTVDTACSSSLTAVYLACEAIHAGDCSAAIVGGVNLDLHQTKLDINRNGGALSVDGVCRSFGKGANGYVAGEGIGAVFLKPLDQAEQDGDYIYGVIKSAVVNHGGRASGYTVPNPKAQSALIVAAFEKAGIDARSIGYIEAHGTGTELGDPIEITGLSNAFKSDAVENQSCAIGSIKSNIGHLEAAAGVASMSKVLLQMKHRQLVPSLHSAELNEFIDFKNSPFYVEQRLENWKGREVDGKHFPLRAGISSFGAGGSNAHIILEHYEPVRQVKEKPDQPIELIFPLSAKNEDQLHESVVRLATFLQENSEDLSDIAHTLQFGRKSFDHRLAIIASTREELLEKLACFIEGKKDEHIITGHVKSSEAIARLLNRREKEEFIRLLSQGRDPRKIMGLWAEGVLASWQGYQSQSLGKRVSLPTYPFVDKRHWVSGKSPVRQTLRAVAGMHPLVDTNESTFERQLFRKTFHDRDFFIYDHHVAGIPTLPGVAYLELARKAGEIAAGRKVQKIRNILWVSPIAVQNSASKEVFIELKPNGAAVRFEVFSCDEKGAKVLHSQGTLLYTTPQEAVAVPEYIDLQSIRARCKKVIEGRNAYPLFKSFGLNLGPSFQVLQEVYKSENEILGVLKLPELRQGDLQSMVLQPSLVDGSLQAGMGAQLGEKVDEMFVPFSIGEVEILHPLQFNCFSYVTEVREDKKDKKANSRVVKSNVLIVDETGKVLVKLRESIGVPLREVYKKPSENADLEGLSKLYYSYDWEKAPLAVEHVEQNSHAFLLFDTEEALRDLYQERLVNSGVNSGPVILVRPGESFQDLGGQSYTVNPQSKDDFSQLFESLIEKKHSIEKICFAWPFGNAGLHHRMLLKESIDRGIYSFLFVCQSVIKHKLDSKARLLYLYSLKPGETQPHNEAVGGFIKSLRLEHPKLLCKTLEVRQESAGCERILDAVLAEFQGHTQDATAVRYEGQERYIRKLKAFDLEEAANPATPQGVGIREKGVYLITGGAGGLGLVFAEFLAREFKARLVLTGRSELSAGQAARLEEIRKSGAEVLYLRADVSSNAAVRNLFNEVKSRFGEIHGVIHAAGVLRDSLVRNKTLEDMGAVFAPKVHGTLHLDEVSRNEQLDFFVMFSSLAAVGGTAWQCDYAFANHFMDSFAAERELLRAKGERSGKTLSFNWSLWADGGMKFDELTELFLKKNMGIKPLSTEMGLEAFVKGLASGKSQFAVLEGVQEKVELAWGLRKKEAAPEAPAAPTQAASAPLPGEGNGDIPARLRNELSQIVMELLKLDAGDIEQDKILLDLGFDSIGLTTFANAINDKYQVEITPVLFFDYPSIGEIAKYLSIEYKNEVLRFYRSSAAAAPTAAASQGHASTGDAETNQGTALEIRKGWNPAAMDREVVTPSSSSGFSPELRFVNEPIAIVGISGVMPQSEDLDAFWENLKNSKDMIEVIPKDRWRWEDYYGDPFKEVNKSNSKWGGFMSEVDKFDPLFFGISPREAQMMDPQQRIFLETVWKAIEDSGQKVSDLSGTKTGLFVGVAANDYVDVLRSQGIALDAYSASGNSHSVLANRVSFLLNLRGPSAPLDTACSSSLVAVHRAIESIHTGSCDMAIVGGVQVMLSPGAYISFGMAGMLSGDGKCKTFDKLANGYVRGEGCGAVFLKRLAVAEADGNHIYAVIKATAENHGGRVTTMTAPNSSAQSALLVEAYEKAQIDPATVGYIECHGTGTSLGDPIEIQALSKAFAELYKRAGKAPAKTPHCGLSSVKTNIGHLETAAGIASLLKVVLAIQHKQIPANIHFEELNPYINLKGTPFYIADQLTPWEAAKSNNGSPHPRRAGVSSFGFGGANAHVVLEEYIVPTTRRIPAQERGPHLIVLSAKNEERLKAYVQSMRAFLEKKEIHLADLAYTLQVGRDEMPERLALVVAGTEELKEKFNEILKGGERRKDSYRGNIKNKDAKFPMADRATEETLVQSLIEQKELSKLAELWVSGAKIDWRLLYASDVPRRISAPSYPFARERYWITGAERKVVELPKESTVQPESQKEPEAGLQSLVPVWNPAHVQANQRIDLPKSTKVLLLGGDQSQLDWLRKSCPNSQLLQLVPTEGVDIIEKKLVDCSFDQLLWIAPDMNSDADRESGADELIIDRQEEGVLAIFRITKALLNLGYANRKLQWTVVTCRTQRVNDAEPMQPTHAGIVGLVGSLAKEYLQWDLRLLDIDSLASVSARECLSLPWDRQGNALAHRGGEWFQQGLALIATLPEVKPAYRQNRVYVVIGGAGGLGEVWSRFMIEHFQASVVWIGRRPYNTAIEEKINSLTRQGRAPLYVSADATDPEALEQACKTILKTYPAIHGVVHSAIVPDVQSISHMEELGFRSSLAAKVDISVNMERVFGKQDLDFMIFFSSTVSFFKSPGQSHYSAGCSFKDSFAHKLQQEHSYPVRTVNWGYWGSVGVVADESSSKLMARMGIGSIEPDEGMASLQALVSSAVPQMMLIKALNSKATAGLNLSEVVKYYSEAAPSVLPEMPAALSERPSLRSIAVLEQEAPNPQLNELVTEILASSLKTLGLFRSGIHTIADLSLEKPPAKYFERWLNASIGYLQQQKWLTGDLVFTREVRALADLWAEWEMKISAWATNPTMQAQVSLLEVCLKALPGVLGGKQRPTEVLFPNSSMHLVEGIYRGNARADYFNEVLGETLIACIECQLRANKDSQIRILEVGAGTGGTTAKLLPMLRRFPIAEYCYTDVSKVFLMHAEKNYKPQFSTLSTALFDVSKPLASQTIAAAHYDFVIAANVLHATSSIRETLRNTKAALKNQGILLLNEISQWSLFIHLTFGLLEGWWLYEDTTVRLAGSPGLATEKWRSILTEEGFESILFPAEEAHKFGQQIIAACSNGWTRQRIAKQVPQQSSPGVERAVAKAAGAAPAKSAQKASDAFSSAELTEQMGNDYIRQIITEKLSVALRMDAAMIRKDASLADYGVDSIIGVNLVRTINEDLEIEVEPAKLFECSTVDQLGDYIWSHWREQVTGRLAQVRGAPQRSDNSIAVEPAEREAASERSYNIDRLAETGNGFRATPKRESHHTSTDSIAIVGMSGRFAESESLDSFWQSLKQGKDLVKKVSRWRAAECAASEPASQPYCSHASFVDSIDRFDPMFFGISLQEATYMDPQQRLFLEECWKALEDAGYAGRSVSEKQCGIYVGCGSSNYDHLFTAETTSGVFWGNSESMIPARIASYLNLQGPAIAVDAACASSLVAIHLACQALWSGETEMALAGGVSLQATPEFHRLANRAGMLSPEGKCYCFDARANGFVPGEAVGVVVLKRLRDALEDGNSVHGVIAGIGINQADCSNGFMTPNAEAQERLVRSVYDRFKINPETIQVVEAHGAGTLPGDSLEYGALSRVMGALTDKKQFCAIGTVKTNIGHAGAAAGIAGVLKVLLSLKHRQIPPSLHFQKGNSAIDFNSGPLYVNTQLKEWRVEGSQKRRAAVSSFGLSGANAHLVLEEAPSVEPAAAEAPGYVVVLSARSSAQLKQQVTNLLALLMNTHDISMNDVAFTLFVGRKHLGHRLSCVARNQKELIRLLEQWCETGAASQIYAAEIQECKIREQTALKTFGNYCIQECRNNTNTESCLEYLATIADLYIQGYSLNFHELFSPASRRIPLPTYPFAREHYWVDASAARPGSADSDSPAPSPHKPANVTTSHPEMSAERALENVLWQEALLNDGYEKVTF
jgi:acyl transferase domain-containing protein/tryptophanase/acyl carrier protein